MKTILTTVALLTGILCSSHAVMTLDWERDLSSRIGAYEVVELLQLSDGTICIGTYSYSGPSANILVYNSSGAFEFHDIIENTEELELVMISAVPNQFAVETWGSSGEEFVCVYEFQGSSYTVTNFISNQSSGGYQSAVNTGFFYTMQGLILKKFILDSAPAVVDGTVASGIDGSNYVLNWNSELSGQYQIQSSTTLTNWIDVGGVITGTGDPISWANALTNSKSFYRVIKQ